MRVKLDLCFPLLVVGVRYAHGSVHFVHGGVLRLRRITVFIELDFCYSQLIISVLHLEKTTVSVSEPACPHESVAAVQAGTPASEVLTTQFVSGETSTFRERQRTQPA